jgi:two-component system, OmpR family, response regulator
MRVLVVEDAVRLLDIIARRLREEGYAVDGVTTGQEAVDRAAVTAYDVIVLDLRLPDISGLDVCERLRATGCTAPILMLTARDGLDDRVLGLDLGADDYMTKPFEFPELFARVRALARRRSLERSASMAVGDLRIDTAAHTVHRGPTRIELTTREFGVLEYLMRHRGQAVSRDRLIDAVWDHAYRGDSNIVDVYIARLRDKIDRPFDRSTLETVRGIGYRLADDAPSTRIA